MYIAHHFILQEFIPSTLWGLEGDGDFIYVVKKIDNVSSRSLPICQWPHGKSWSWKHDVQISNEREGALFVFLTLSMYNINKVYLYQTKIYSNFNISKIFISIVASFQTIILCVLFHSLTYCKIKCYTLILVILIY